MRVACIGSRELDEQARALCWRIGYYLASLKHEVATGGAVGADQAYAAGAATVNPKLVWVYPPWPDYELGARPSGINVVCDDWTAEEWAYGMEHPAWDRLSQGAQKMMVRNARIIIGSQLVSAYPRMTDQKVEGRGYHTPQPAGGTAHGLKIAEMLGIRISNLALPQERARLENIINTANIPQPTRL